MEELPPHLRQQVEELTCTKEGPRNVETINYGAVFSTLGLAKAFDLEDFKKSFKIKINHISEERLKFDLVGIDVAYANAFRRIMIAEVPTMAIETVHLWQNTGVIQDEVLCHRLGLIPFKVDPITFKYRTENEEHSADNSLCYSLHITCTENNMDPALKCLPVYSRDFVWKPLSERQAEAFKDNPPGPINGDILITKLRPGQEIEAICYVEKGIGKTHAKWSPAAPAVYRLQPRLVFPEGPLKGEEAEELKELCPMNVFDVEDAVSTVRDARACTTCRACIERFPTQVEIRKIKNHFIFSVESTGAIPAVEIFRRAIQVFIEKLSKLKSQTCQ
eukprot:Protomagalhaensia_wolfi_Nauph_80__4863@NODE_50_length_4187_cov_153_098843_g41_i0_p1_GENE_NODE_50_length_4187_cov_153_098843_g41_i0NODE_50_length_4187_cov_153_098843_g41_i0_p1_ORF_typecomplete_len333_score61_52RNA_pol_L/PF01193_24/8_9e52RNA_pol_A_bac/PF01000_26/1_7e33RNA_pol_A_bac/PF01000_26/3_7e03Fer4_9/PF13187_6/0_0031ETF_QO/PF05187_13/0_098Fer4_18/PF13746_6/0_1Fer4_8/PF13183_6/0_11_NODE_50_length_4187_cov_153_098843_g41_i06281626